jgi:hypothetical protein
MSAYPRLAADQRTSPDVAEGPDKDTRWCWQAEKAAQKAALDIYIECVCFTRRSLALFAFCDGCRKLSRLDRWRIAAVLLGWEFVRSQV